MRPSWPEELLGQQILAAKFPAPSPAQGGQDLLERPPVTSAGHYGLLRPGQEPLGVAGQLGQKPVKPPASNGR